MCGRAHLEHYTDLNGARAFQTYDRIGSVDRLDPVDLLAPALLDAPLRGEHVIAMHLPTGAYRDLLNALTEVVAHPDTASARFEDQDLGAEEGPWSLVREALVASDSTPGIKASKVTKILHRKRPHLVPIFDSRVAGYYGIATRRPWLLWPRLQHDVRRHGRWLEELGGRAHTSDGRNVSALRVLDIIVWEHTIRCPA